MISEQAVVVTVSSPGPDRYADGSLVADGESYALVAVNAGSAFGGFSADGALCDLENNSVLFVLPLAKDGRCPKTTVAIESTGVTRTESLKLVLLDTRATVRSGAALRVDGWSVVSQATASFGSVAEATADSVFRRSKVPSSVGMPRVTGFRREGADFVLRVEGTSNVLDYNVSAGDSPQANDGVNVAREPKTGDATQAIELRVPADETSRTRFFKVIRDGGDS